MFKKKKKTNNKKINRERKYNGDCQRLQEGGYEQLLSNGYRVSVFQTGKNPEVSGGDGCITM